MKNKFEILITQKYLSMRLKQYLENLETIAFVIVITLIKENTVEEHQQITEDN